MHISERYIGNMLVTQNWIIDSREKNIILSKSVTFQKFGNCGWLKSGNCIPIPRCGTYPHVLDEGRLNMNQVLHLVNVYLIWVFILVFNHAFVFISVQ